MTTKREGLERVALDLHVHTPGSGDWRDGEISAQQLVEQAIAVGLDGIAITDHGTGDWIDDVKAAAAGTPLVVFPGVELNNLAGNEGIHLICLFGADVTSADIDRFLTTIGVLRGAGERLERGTATSGPLEVLEEVERFGGIAVLAHCQSSKGALGAMRGDLRTTMVQHPVVLAAEAPAEDYHDEQKRSQGKRTYDLLDGSDSTYRRELAVYQASDNPSGEGHGHDLVGIGSRFTYFYVERPITLESLRQCFVDRAARIEYPLPGATIGGDGRAVPGITRLQVTGGFLDGLDLAFHEGLTTVLGPKGAGESNRRRAPALRARPRAHPARGPKGPRHEARQAARPLRPGHPYRPPRGRERAEGRAGVNPAAGNPYHGVTLPASELLPCHFLSQGEIVRIAENEEQQIQFIDSFFDFRAHQRGIDEVRQQLAALDSEVATQIRARKTVGALQAEQRTLRDEIAKRDAELKSPVFGKFQQAQAKMQTVDRGTAAVADVHTAVAQARMALEAVPGPPEPPPELASDPLVRRLHELAVRAKAEALERLTETVDAVASLGEEARREQETWQPVYASIADEYSREAQKAGGDVPALSQARARLVTRLAEVETRLNAAGQTAALLRPTVERRKDLLETLRERQAAYTQARQERCDWFEEKSDGQIRARVSAGSNRDDFRERLSEMKKGSYLSAGEIEGIVAACSPDEFVNTLLRYDLSRNSDDLAAVASASGLAVPRVAALAEFMLGEGSEIGYESLLELQYAVTPTDRPEIAFRREDGSYAPLEELSTGQKSTALLVMALCEGDAPIIVDQPEDSLDIRSIWEDMCLRLRLSKRSRQFIFTTHNSSLAVASDTDKFVVLVADAQHADVVLAGAIDGEEVRREVIKLLEGGTSTYFLKQRKYNISDPYGR